MSDPEGERAPMPGLRNVAAAGILLLLLATLFASLAVNLDTRLVQAGEWAWPGYAAELRADPIEPDCELSAFEAQLQTCVATDAEPSPGGDDPFGGEDPFADDADPFAGDADPFAGDADPFAGDADPFADDADPFADDADPFAGDDPFADQPAPSGVPCAAVESARDSCQVRHDLYASVNSRRTGAVLSWVRFEGTVASLSRLDAWKKHLLVLLVLLGAFVTTVRREHIALRMPETPWQHRVEQGSQLLAHLLLLVSCVVDWQVQHGSSAEAENQALPVLWTIGFTALIAVNLRNLVKPPGTLTGPPSVLRTLMVVPLYVWMVLISGAWFYGVQAHPSGQAIFLHKFAQIPNIYLGIGLYIFAGMLLERTQLTGLAFGLVTPWKLPPTILAWIVVVVAAVPTAYSGASGIFVIAAGAEIFRHLREAGASRRMAVAATAMSGSLGVVLRPCLVVVLISMLNKQVTTDALFSHGLVVFGLTATLLLIAMVVRNKDGWHMAPVSAAVPAMARAFRPLVPYLALTVGVLVIFATALATTVNEHTAPFVLPVVMLALVALDRRLGDPGQIGLIKDRVFSACTSSSGHIGALLMLMTASVCLGGVVERSEVMTRLLPQTMGSPFMTMTVLVVIMVVVGMTMDALGAVVLVSVSIAPYAYENGIDPVHFWMMVLVAFELGYLTPPVAINHLLARQVAGPEARVENFAVEGGVLARYEHVLLPMAVMGTALVLVAFVPLVWAA